MNHNRSKNFKSKQASIASVSSHVPLMSTSKNDETYLLTQALINSNVKADTHSLLQSFTMNSSRDSKRSRTVCPPKGTIPYIVDNNDTLEKVALRFNSTPSQLRKLNKLNTSMIFPGQTLFVPEECPTNNSNQQQSLTSLSSPSPTTSPSSSTKSKDGDAFMLQTDNRLSSESSLSPPPPSNSHHQTQQDVGPIVWSMTRQVVARPGRAERLKSDPTIESEPSPPPPPSSSKTLEGRLSRQLEDNSEELKALQKPLTIDENHQLDDECLQRFIKVNVRLMTEDHKSVAGTLLVTPNALMFDPDVLDPLVKEHGIDKYGLIIRMDLLAGIALYEDLAMYEHEATVRDEEKRKMYHSTSVKNSQHNSTNIFLNTDEEQIHDLMLFLLDKIDKELNPCNSTDTHILFNASSTLQRYQSKTSIDNNDNETFLPISTDENLFEISNNSFQPLNDYKNSITILQNDNNENLNQNYHHIPSQISYVFDWTRFKRAIKIQKGYHLENCVSLDQCNKRFDEVDKLLYKQQQTYFFPNPIEIPYYLCIKTSIHINDIPSLHPKQYKKTHGKQFDYIYGEKKLEYEYWFSVPKEKTDHLYSFFLRWTPERELNPLIDDDNDHDHIQDLSKSNDNTSNKGFVLLATDDPELTGDYIPTKNSKNRNKKVDEQKKPHHLRRQNTLLKEWEIISVDEIYRRINAAHSTDADQFDIGIPAPKLLQQSTLINEEQAKHILLELPARIHGLDWYMIFSTEANGFSLNQLYRRSLEIDRDLPALLIIKDIEQNIFGAFIPHQLMISEGFYGNGESFLFTFYQEFRVFNWSGLNDFFVKGDLHALGFGSGEGTYGLWIDADLYHGRTCPSKTYNNEMLTTHEDFIIASIEVWTFTD